MVSFYEQTFMQNSPFGIGVSFGEPTGVNSKLWVSRTDAFAFGAGLSLGVDRIGELKQSDNKGQRIHFHFDYLIHVFNAFGLTEQLPIYYGIGGRFNTGAGYKNSLAVRFATGLTFIPGKLPIDFFAEFVPSLQLTPEPGFAIDYAIGSRYYF